MNKVNRKMPMAIMSAMFTVFSFYFLLSATVLGQTAKFEWKTYQFKNLGFSIESPVVFKLHASSGDKDPTVLYASLLLNNKNFWVEASTLRLVHKTTLEKIVKISSLGLTRNKRFSDFKSSSKNGTYFGNPAIFSFWSFK